MREKSGNAIASSSQKHIGITVCPPHGHHILYFLAAAPFCALIISRFFRLFEKTTLKLIFYKHNTNTLFVPIFLIVSVAAKQKLWVSIVGSLGASMLLFTMTPMLTPLDSSIMNVVLCLAGGVLFSIGLGAVSRKILTTTGLV